MVSQNEFTTKVVEMSGQNIFSCNLCGKCTAGCPVASVMDIKPHQLVRRIQMGDVNLVNSRTIWLCASCLACATRCPKKIEIPKLMESLRILVLSKGIDYLEYNTSLSSELPLQALVAARSKFSSVNLPMVSPLMRLSKFFVSNKTQVKQVCQR